MYNQGSSHGTQNRRDFSETGIPKATKKDTAKCKNIKIKNIN